MNLEVSGFNTGIVKSQFHLKAIRFLTFSEVIYEKARSWQTDSMECYQNLGGRTGKILRPSSVALKSKNQEINRLQLAVKLPWAIFFESVDILS
ncbi:hypothetical protein TNCV_210061 [Trichonephila clavipes]|uniref:Uncharacterized protein n=1 Tax=Trichonephila clavipes TaxID=2585209 RepID=A0A8X6VNK8_TRICX|nr:hypothetical protein TNCV_210061 [Trichonephila clavipes]